MTKQEKNAPASGAATTTASTTGVASPDTNGGAAHRDGRAPAEEQIRMRAYSYYLERGQQKGDPLGDWLRAEREYGAGSHDQPATGGVTQDLAGR